MRYSILINQLKCVEAGLKYSEGALMDLIGQLNTWAVSEVIEGEVFYNLSYGKIIEEQPLIFKKKDTVYRAMNVLKKKQLIEVVKVGQMNRNFVQVNVLITYKLSNSRYAV